MSPSSTKALAIGFLALAFCLPVRADDSAVSVAVGGIRLSKEAHISMEKERLSIGLHKITVDFDFLNETDKDITIEVGFPVPPYEWYAWEPGLRRDFADFHVWVDGSAIQYKKDVRGKVKGRDYTDLILASHLPLDFAENNPDDSTTDSSAAPAPAPRDPVLDLSPADRSKLLNLGLIKAIDNGDYVYLWSVVKTYHWTQRFPAHKILHIRHEYVPEYGFEPVEVGKLQRELKDSCIEDSLENKLKADVAQRLKSGDTANGEYVYPEWVDYILTSANTWKTPIKSFELDVERPKTDGQRTFYVSFCWDGKVERADADHFVARVANFVPARELRIYFLPSD